MVDAETLTLKVRAVSIDGAPMAVPNRTYILQSGCGVQSLSGTLLEPDDQFMFRSTLRGLETAP